MFSHLLMAGGASAAPVSALPQGWYLGSCGNTGVFKIAYSETYSGTWARVTVANEVLQFATDGIVLVAVGAGGLCLYTEDGETWETVDLGITARIKTLCYDGTAFVCVANGGTSYSSLDGKTWSSLGTAYSSVAGYGIDPYQMETDGAGTLVIHTAENGKIMTSTNHGASWTTRVSEAGRYMRGGAFNGTSFIVGGDFGTLYTATDASSWASNSTPSGSDIGYRGWGGNGIFMWCNDGYGLKVGSAWNSMATKISNFTTPYGTQPGFWDSENNIWMMNGVLGGTTYFKYSTDSGNNWSNVSNYPFSATVGGAAVICVRY